MSRERAMLISQRGYAALAPDLVAEILSPDDRPREMLAKVGEWLEAGVQIAWVIDPDRKMAQAYRSDGSITPIASDGWLDGESVLAGFSCALRELFD